MPPDIWWDSPVRTGHASTTPRFTPPLPPRRAPSIPHHATFRLPPPRAAHYHAYRHARTRHAPYTAASTAHCTRTPHYTAPHAPAACLPTAAPPSRLLGLPHRDCTPTRARVPHLCATTLHAHWHTLGHRTYKTRFGTFPASQPGQLRGGRRTGTFRTLHGTHTLPPTHTTLRVRTPHCTHTRPPPPTPAHTPLRTPPCATHTPATLHCTDKRYTMPHRRMHTPLRSVLPAIPWF